MHNDSYSRLKSLKPPTLDGPVGFSFATLGYSLAVLVARAFVTLESLCTQACPIVRVQGFRLHHIFYGLVLVALSMSLLALAEDTRTKWDGALVAGIGAGLIIDEVGLLVLRVQYWSPTSLMIIGAVGASLMVATAVSMMRRGLEDFRLLDKAHMLTVFAVLLGMAGFVYFDRPFHVMVAQAAVGAWAVSFALMMTAGRTHFLRILRG